MKHGLCDAIEMSFSFQQLSNEKVFQCVIQASNLYLYSACVVFGEMKRARGDNIKKQAQLSEKPNKS